MTTGADVEVTPGLVTGSGTAARRVAEVLRDEDVAGPVGAVGAALPGSTTAASAAALARRWAASLTGTADGFAAQSAALAASVRCYTAGEQVIAESLR